MLEIFSFLSQDANLKGITAKPRALWHSRNLIDAEFRHDIFNRGLSQNLQRCNGITHVLRSMNQTSVLGTLLYQTSVVFVGRCSMTYFMLGTVDQHILMVGSQFAPAFMTEHAHEYPGFWQPLMANFGQPLRSYRCAVP